MNKIRNAKYQIGQVVRHRLFPFRGVVFDIDPIFSNTEEWYESIPAEMRPHKDQPFYHLFAENDETEYIAYVSEQNLLPGQQRRAGPASAGRGSFRQRRQGRLSPASRDDATELPTLAESRLESAARSRLAAWFSPLRARR